MFGSNYGRDERENSAPINEGEEYDVKIEDLGRDGDGITRIEGFVVFVSGAKVGDEVVIVGDQNSLTITVDAFSEVSQQVNYEILSRISREIPRILVD